MSYVTFIVESSTMFVLEKQSAVKPRDQLVRKKKSLHSLWSVEGIPNATYPGQPRPRQQTCAPKSQNFHILSWEPFIFVYSIFQNSILHIFFIYHNCSVSQDVPKCSGTFHIPAFNDRPPRDHICITLHLHILLSVSVDLQLPLIALASIPNETSGLQKTRVSWELTQTDCKYVQVTENV